MPESAAARLEHKVDTLIDNVGELRTSHQRLTDQMVADKRLTDQLLGFMQQAVDRLQGEVDSDRAAWRAQVDKEQKAREEGDENIRSTLSKIGFALFTALLAITASGLAYVLFQGR